MHSCDELFLRTLECYFGVYFPHCFATRETNTKPSKHTTSSQRREDVLLGRREDVLFAPTLG